MVKNGLGWIIAIVFVFAFGVMWVAYSKLKEDYQIENGQNYYDFHAAVTADIQLMEQVLSLEKLIASGNEDLQILQTSENEWGLQGGPFVDVGLTETALRKLTDYRNESVLAIMEFQRTGNRNEIEKLKESLSAYKQQFNHWVEEVNECSHLSGFCAGDGSEAYQKSEN